MQTRVVKSKCKPFNDTVTSQNILLQIGYELGIEKTTFLYHYSYLHPYSLHCSMNLKSSCSTLCKFVDMNKSPNEALMHPIYFNPFPTIPAQFILLQVVYK